MRITSQISTTLLVLAQLGFVSCETEGERLKQLKLEEQRREEVAMIAKRENEEARHKAMLENIAREQKLEQERVEKIIYDKYINNSLTSGTTPYGNCFGKNKVCSNYGCSKISVRTPSNSDVIVTLKQYDKVVRHAYIKASSKYTFEIPNGTYQTFFYYGKGWNPEKRITSSSCSELKGGFITNESFGKDDPQRLSDNILEYELILTQNGNFSTDPSNSREAF